MPAQDIKLTADGQIDYDFYIKLAHQQRAEFTAQLFKKAANWFMGLFKVRSIECMQAKPCH